MPTDVLVLNRNYFAIQVCDWKKAFSLLFQGAAETVDENLQTYNFKDWADLSEMMKESPNGFINTPTLKLAVPEIIKLTTYSKLPRAQVKFTRSAIYNHYKNRCCYCGNIFKSSELNLDHVMPSSRGGKTNWSNIVTSCIPCNTKKSNRTPDEAGMTLLVRPTEPKWLGYKTLLEVRLPFTVKKSWQQFLDKAYWDTELED